MWPPRPSSVSVNLLPSFLVPSSTLPLYSLSPLPVWISSYWKSFLPVLASVMTCSLLGVPSLATLVTTVS